MKNILFVTLALLVGCASANAQYFCTKQGQVMYYKQVANEDKQTKESVMKSTVVSVETAADGIISSRVEDLESDPSNPFAEIKTYKSFTYDPATDVTKVIVMTGDDFKDFVLTMIRESAEANRQHMSDSDLDDLAKSFSTKGSLEFLIDPKSAVDTKIPNSTLRLNAGQMTMTMNFWEGKYLGKEKVTVEAGTYDCEKVSYTLRISTPGGNQKRNITEWYAKEVGPVRAIETDKKGNILNELTLRVIK